MFSLAEILPDFQYVHKSLKILEKQIANVFRGYINYLITNQTSSQVHLIQLIQSHEYTCNLRIYQRNKRLKNVCFFINPGKSYVPIWKDETTLLKMHAELTYKQNEKQYFKHTLQFSLVRASDRSRKKSQISRDFQVQICAKIGRFHGNFAGVFGADFTKKQSVKNSSFCGYFQGKFRQKSIGFALIRPAFLMFF